jgi:hypothetical protein
VPTIGYSAWAEKKPLTTEEPVNAGLRSMMHGGDEGYLLARHSPLFLLIFTGSPCSGFLLHVPAVLR